MSMPESFEAVRCPFCGAASAQLLSLFGSQLLLSQYRCRPCGSYFEGLRPDRWEPDPVGLAGARQSAEPTPGCSRPQPPPPSTTSRPPTDSAAAQPEAPLRVDAAARRAPRSRAEGSPPSQSEAQHGKPTGAAEFARVCDHPQQSVLPATGENHDGR
jgi:hypothetical protein